MYDTNFRVGKATQIVKAIETIAIKGIFQTHMESKYTDKYSKCLAETATYFKR